jgi:hypothetical protein
MELELLKEQWDRMNRKIQQTEKLNLKLVESIISARVLTTVDKIKRMYFSFYLLLIIEAVFLIGILFGNPFDFSYRIQYLPYLLIFIGVLVAFVNLVKIHSAINKLSPSKSIGEYLKKIVSVYDRNKRFEKWFGAILFFVGSLVPFSFLPHKLERLGIVGALLDIAIMFSITLLLYGAAYKLGAFKNRHKQKLEQELIELEQLKALTNSID